MSASAGAWPGKLAWWAWLVLLAAIPVTSFPLVQRTIGGETVSPLSLLPLIVLIVWLVGYLLRGGGLPIESGPLLLFMAVAIASSLLAFFSPMGPYKNQTLITRGLDGLVTLAVGAGFFLSSSLVVRDRFGTMISLRAITLGGVLSLIWSTAQAWYVLFIPGYIPPALNELHRLISSRDLFWDRVTGLAYEPSWFGNQLVILYIPLWIGSIVTGHSAFGRRRVFTLIELVMVLWAIAMLLMARTRISIASLALMTVALLSFALWRGSGFIVERFRARRRLAVKAGVAARLGILLVGIALFLIVLTQLVSLSARYDSRMRGLIRASGQLAAIRAEHPYEAVYALANRSGFAERLIYWKAGIAGFEQNPTLGVGPGNAGFLFAEQVPAFGHRLVEIRDLLDPGSPNFPNPKSLWVRLLAETGLIGFAAFAVWLLLLTASSVAVIRRGKGVDRALGVAGLLALVAQLTEGLSLDTFALPQLWIAFGLLTSAARRLRYRVFTDFGD